MSEPSQPPVQSLHTEGVYKSSKPVAELFSDLKALASVDKEAEKQVKTMQTLGYVGIGAVVCSVFVCMASGVFVYVAWGIVIGGIVLNRWAAAREKVHEKEDFPDHRYIICEKLARLLSADMSSDSLLNTMINLKEKPDSPAQVKEGNNGKATWKSLNTADQFLQLDGRLVDGTKFDFGLTEKVDAYGEHFTYRSMSGKTKIKLKARKRVQWAATLRLRFKEKRYANAPSEVSQIEQLIQLPDGSKLKKLESTDQELVLTAVSAPTKLRNKVKGSHDIPAAWKAMSIDSKTTDGIGSFSAQLFLGLYQALNTPKTT